MLLHDYRNSNVGSLILFILSYASTIATPSFDFASSSPIYLWAGSLNGSSPIYLWASSPSLERFLLTGTPT